MMDAKKAFTAAVHEKVSLLEQVKIQAQVLVPLIKAFRAEFGEQRANEVARKALWGWSQKLYSDIAGQLPGSPREKWQAMWDAMIATVGNDIDLQPLKEDNRSYEFNITGCRYADFFRQLGEPELGALLLCDMDIHFIEQVGAPDVELTRTQTIMKGAPYCDFRFKLK
jgi:L-2-amino-thiazoline-4-carboxylic acid hydrolase